MAARFVGQMNVDSTRPAPAEKKDETKKDETKKDETKKDETKKDETKKDETKKDAAKKDETKKDAPATTLWHRRRVQPSPRCPGSIRRRTGSATSAWAFRG